MQDTAIRLAAIGFGRRGPEPNCWRHRRLDRRLPQIKPEPECSAELLRWRDLLAREHRPSPYRISRIAR